MSPSDAPACAGLIPRLPQSVAGLPRHRLPVGFRYAVLWGTTKASVQLQCGTSRPAELVETSTLFDVDAVTWFAVPEGPITRYTAVDRRPYVQVIVPSAVSPDQVLVPVGKAVATLPKAPVVTSTG